MQGGVAIGIRHVDYELQQLRGDGPESLQVQGDPFWICFYVAGKPQPIGEHCCICHFLQQCKEVKDVKKKSQIRNWDNLVGIRTLVIYAVHVHEFICLQCGLLGTTKVSLATVSLCATEGACADIL